MKCCVAMESQNRIHLAITGRKYQGVLHICQVCCNLVYLQNFCLEFFNLESDVHVILLIQLLPVFKQDNGNQHAKRVRYDRFKCKTQKKFRHDIRDWQAKTLELYIHECSFTSLMKY